MSKSFCVGLCSMTALWSDLCQCVTLHVGHERVMLCTPSLWHGRIIHLHTLIQKDTNGLFMRDQPEIVDFIRRFTDPCLKHCLDHVACLYVWSPDPTSLRDSVNMNHLALIQVVCENAGSLCPCDAPVLVDKAQEVATYTQDHRWSLGCILGPCSFTERRQGR